MNIWQSILFSLAVVYGAVRRRDSRIAGNILMLVAGTGSGLSLLAVFGTTFAEWLRTFCWEIVAICVVIVFEKRLLHLQQQTTVLAQQIAIDDARIREECHTKCL
jgi:hypothetical protein